MSRADDKELRADLVSILSALVAEPVDVDDIGRRVLGWLQDNADTVDGHQHAFMAAMSVRDALAAIDSGAASARDPELADHYRRAPVAQRTVVALHELCGHSISDTADRVRRPAYEVAGLVADFRAPVPEQPTPGVPPGAPTPAEASDSEARAAASRGDGADRPPVPRSSRRERSAASPSAPADTKVRPAFLVALGIVVAVALVAFVVNRVTGGGDGDSAQERGAAARQPGEGATGSPACIDGGGADAVEDESVVVTVNGTERTVRLHAPAPVQGVPSPLVVDLGDIGQTVEEHLATSQIRSLPFFAPAAIATLVPADGLPQWNVGEAADEPADVDAVVGAIDAIGSRICIDTSRVYVVGFGSGAHLASRVACRHGDLLEGVAMVAGFDQPSDCAADQNTRTLIVVTSTDDVFPTEGGTGPGFDARVGDGSELRAGSVITIAPLADVVQSWTENAGCDPGVEGDVGGLAAVTYEGCSDGTTLTLVTASEVGHVWPQSAVSALQEFVV